MLMIHTPTLLVNAVLGAMAVAVGLWFLQGDLSSSATIFIIVGLTILYAKVCPTAAHVWMWSTLLLGVESLAWPFQLVGELEQYGAEPPIEEMSKVLSTAQRHGLPHNPLNALIAPCPVGWISTRGVDGSGNLVS